MLSKEYRMKKSDFDLIKGLKKKIFSSESFNLKVCSVENLKTSKFSVVISKKVYKKAVVRNKTKRQIKGFIQKNKQNFKNGFLIVIFLKKETQEEKIKELEYLFKKASIWKC